MNNADGGTNGIWLNSYIDSNWTIYRSSSFGLSSSGNKTCAGYGSFSSYALRLRVFAGSDQGILFENSNEQLLFSVNALTAETYIGGAAFIANSLTINGLAINSGAQDPSNQNCGYGFNCLNTTFTGLSNTGNGCNSLYFLTTGSYCSSFGSGAL